MVLASALLIGAMPSHLERLLKLEMVLDYVREGRTEERFDIRERDAFTCIRIGTWPSYNGTFLHEWQGDTLFNWQGRGKGYGTLALEKWERQEAP